MLSVLASIALVVGGISATMVLTEENRLSAEEAREPIIEVQGVETVETRATEMSR